MGPGRDDRLRAGDGGVQGRCRGESRFVNGFVPVAGRHHVLRWPRCGCGLRAGAGMDREGRGARLSQRLRHARCDVRQRKGRDPELAPRTRVLREGDRAGPLQVGGEHADPHPPHSRGNADCQWQVGSMYYNGRGVDVDYAQALPWLEKAAAQDQPKAVGQLGTMYSDGQGVTPSFRRTRVQREGDQAGQLRGGGEHAGPHRGHSNGNEPKK